MNYDELAFFNQQLAAMLRDGIPLESALKQLCEGMSDGSLKAKLESLQEDLAKGTPLKEALARRSLPPFYVRMMEIGAKSNDLPGMLTLLADHYHRANALWTRLKGLMVYPLIVIVVALGLTVVLSLVFSHFLSGFFEQIMSGGQPASLLVIASVWMPPLLFGIAAAICLAILLRPDWRGRLRWRLPGFREASLSQLASALAIMLKNGLPLAEALALSEMLEAGTPAGKVLRQWHADVQSGKGKPAQWTAPSRPFPPLFLWLVRQGGEDPAAGFQKASEIYHQRASYRIEMALYGVLPVSILLLGSMVLWQVAPLMRTFIQMMNMLGDVGQ